MAGAKSPFLVGTSGWIYPHWKDAFYPPKLASRLWLSYLAERLPSVEVNGTFYSLTRPSACERWREAVPPGFVFALKGSRYITHMLKLANFRAPLANFFASGVLRLGRMLGPVLWQLPPQLPFRAERADAFFAALPRTVREAERWARRHDSRTTGRAALTAPDGRDNRLLHAVEVRHESWLCDEALRLLERRSIALVAADTASRHPLSLVRTSRELAYVRLHGARRLYEGRYTEDELQEWARRCREWASDGALAAVYFDNDRGAAAPRDAVRMWEILSGREASAEPVTEPEAPLPPRETPAHFGAGTMRRRERISRG
ncbi:MAG TPA: DUF72 domain-containing protein [Thermoanaerobaculia bacterium]|jgi:uncharacterized protein YecE (DUF72 family)|nr:DUF72 domain-containing protein [Thermoanaerobaculia bacterium]